MNDNTSRVLVVDDNRVNRIKATRALKTGNYDVSEAAGGQEALDMLRGQVFHLVLLDILMPEVDGFQVLEQMQNDQQLAQIPVIMVSAVEEEEDVRKCMAMGAVDYITKPFDVEVLQGRVRSNLKKAPR
ncbi:response regulator [Gammaproteobacteria bacterium]|nr:response regulator [Gammaproteobacteria bacterium]